MSVDDTSCDFDRVCSLTNEEISANISAVRANIARVLRECGREDDVMLLGACKTMDRDVTHFIIENGLLDALGDNKVQELLDKFEYSSNVPWHFIGNLQTNKVKYIIDKVQLIHSLDRLSLAKEIDRQAKKHDLIMDCLIELNVGREESKGGLLVEDVMPFVDAIKGYDNIRIVGLMSVMPNESDKTKLESYYMTYNDIFDRLKAVYGEQFKTKSIGMSGDYETALRYGANLIRIGRLIFGARRYT